ncbi:hypothetical protein RKE25_13855 [Dyella sp. BiH032]|uniref:hypothetical protein n=1 Tax=Dyella sp. BiH032 TaxID=3075430 RepID=UPI0028932B3D|nr:hypothetical protein [Dyella sp. BiH032]WNL44514.1 hypothetical protein RKE25_13855 [Dyella sp. BiH032]
MRELTGEYNGFQYDMSFIPDGEKTICVFAIAYGGEIVDLRSEIFHQLPAGVEGELAIRQAIQDHIDRWAGSAPHP